MIGKVRIVHLNLDILLETLYVLVTCVNAETCIPSAAITRGSTVVR